jgi:hypothetical protein
MNQFKEIEKSELRTLISSNFIEPGFNYWFSNHDHVRSPFPVAIKTDVKDRTTSIFLEWMDGLKENELSQMKDAEFAEMFETILFNEAMKLVDDEDQQLTITYPFMPRIGDKVNHAEHGEGKVISRKATMNKDNRKFFCLSVLSQNTGETWETQFEISA